jgi:hypothetical protein
VLFVKPMTKTIQSAAFLAALTLTGCANLGVGAISDMMGLSKRTYASKPEPTTSDSSAPIAIAPPAGSNANANTFDFVSYRIAAAKKIMQANGGNTFFGPIPEPLASIPVIEISLNADGSVRAIDVLRTPHFYPETIEMARAAVRRAAPFGSVAHLPKPWTFNETFLYNEELKFQLHALQP